MGNKQKVPIIVLILIGVIIAVLVTGCLPQPMVKPTLNKMFVSSINLQRCCFLEVPAFGTGLFIPTRQEQDTIQDMFDLAYNGYPIWLDIQDEYYE